MTNRGKVESFVLPPHFPFLPNKKISSDYLFIRIRVLSTKVISLFVRRIHNPSFRSVKFVFTVLTLIFWCLSLPTRNIFTFTFWTNLNKILSRQKKFIMMLFNHFIFFFYQNLISDFRYYNYIYKEICMRRYQ